MKDWLTEEQQAKFPREERRTRLHAWVLALAFAAPLLARLSAWLAS